MQKRKSRKVSWGTPCLFKNVLFIKKKETRFIKHTKNIPFPEARKIVESYMGNQTYANVAQKVNQRPEDSTPWDKYKNIIEKLMNLKNCMKTLKECNQ